ncbi:hypothetical protein [Pelosinus sp. UFO1]|uniref:hypothetical protein n=1 Tax=Pelosinus sp. UFO1 TaxID=484770 RepID=UPI0004D1254A|nr:hypothetical protein [Pelosinus sp. UFO1]AIF53743.1 hypothetical protein UFO1_4200 [Pelosinus sp. UFO1]
MWRKFISLTILTLFICSNMGLVFAKSVSEMTVLDKVAAVEKFFYGAEMTGALVERMSKLEKDVMGKESKDALLNRADTLYSYCHDNFVDAPSFFIKLNAVEWSLTHTVTAGPAKARIENLEHVLTGVPSTGSYDERLNKLLKLAYANGKISITNAAVSKDSLLKIKLVTPLNTRTSRPGDVVTYQTADDIYVDGNLVIPKGSQGQGVVTKVEGARNFGRNAQLQVTFDTVEAIDGTMINTILGEKAKEENKSLATAAGASIAGMAILGPIGIVGGAFVHGKEVEIPVGTEMYIQTKVETSAYGIQGK